MATRFTYSTRDWFWLSLVLCLAIGWGTQYRYSQWIEDNVVKSNSNQPGSAHALEEAQLELGRLRAKEKLTREDMDATDYAIGLILTESQYEQLRAKRKEWRDRNRYP
jgi:hypothetical protein